jgi:hypothetical protein
MTNCANDFIDTSKSLKPQIIGIKGSLSTSRVGTMLWIVQDHQGQTHQFDILGIHHVTDLPIRLLSPQHVSREIYKRGHVQDGMTCTTFANRVILIWNNGYYQRIIHLKNSNLPILQSGPKTVSKQKISTKWSEKAMKAYKAYLPLTSHNNQPTHYDQLVPTAVSNTLEAQPNLKSCTIQEELIIWNQRLSHMPFKNLPYIATMGQIPTCLSKVSPLNAHGA